MVKIGENRGEKTKTQQFSHNTSCCAKFSHDTSLVRICFYANFQKMHALGPFPKSQCEFHRNANLVRTLCEFVFGTNFQNHALCLGIPQECEIFAQHNGLCEIRTSSLKVVFSSSNAKFLLHFSQYLSSDHPIPSLSPFSSSFPIPHSQHHHGSLSP